MDAAMSSIERYPTRAYRRARSSKMEVSSWMYLPLRRLDKVIRFLGLIGESD